MTTGTRELGNRCSILLSYGATVLPACRPAGHCARALHGSVGFRGSEKGPRGPVPGRLRWPGRYGAGPAWSPCPLLAAGGSGCRNGVYHFPPSRARAPGCGCGCAKAVSSPKCPRWAATTLRCTPACQAHWPVAQVGHSSTGRARTVAYSSIALLPGPSIAAGGAAVALPRHPGQDGRYVRPARSKALRAPRQANRTPPATIELACQARQEAH